MPRIRSIHLAGPMVRHPQAAVLAEIRLLCEAAGFHPMIPADEVLTETEPSEAMAREIYASRIASVRRADAVIVDLSPFRGPHCDPAAAFEAGVAAGLGKAVFAYMNVPSEDEAELCARVDAYVGAERDADGLWRDVQGFEIETYGLPESLMLWAECRRLYVIVTPELHADLTGIQLCLEAVKLYSD